MIDDDVVRSELNMWKDMYHAAKRDEREIEVLRHERDHARASKDRCVQILSGIHALLYPPLHTNAEGVTFAFHSPHVHEQMQVLSDRIRAIPDEINSIKTEFPG